MFSISWIQAFLESARVPVNNPNSFPQSISFYLPFANIVGLLSVPHLLRDPSAFCKGKSYFSILQASLLPFARESLPLSTLHVKQK
jgi:hypothetical protein